jgi:hypothetical protein
MNKTRWNPYAEEYLKTTVIYKSRLKWIFISGFICGTILGTIIVKMWVKL